MCVPVVVGEEWYVEKESGILRYVGCTVVCVCQLSTSWGWEDLKVPHTPH